MGRRPDLIQIEKYRLLLSPHFGKPSREIAEATGLKEKHVQQLMKRHDWPRLAQAPRKGTHNPAWTGGVIVDKSGYRLIRNVNHPRRNSLGYVREHRLVMEKHLGRYLTPKEVVHHKNGVRDDNRLENLELFGSNGAHLKKELNGKKPRWSREGEKRIRAAVLRIIPLRKRNRGKFAPDDLPSTRKKSSRS